MRLTFFSTYLRTKPSTNEIKLEMPKEREIEKKRNIGGPLFDKTLGQHILKNPLVVKSIVEKV
jgi:hypothetical protein